MSNVGPQESNLCPSCGARKVQVIDTRFVNNQRVRRRRCVACDHRWGTVEVDLAVGRLMAQAARQLVTAEAALREVSELLKALRETPLLTGEDGNHE